eukprot:scaffold128_cov248-Pinguiococcus_pyrenoidosus.AAC.47
MGGRRIWDNGNGEVSACSSCSSWSSCSSCSTSSTSSSSPSSSSLSICESVSSPRSSFIALCLLPRSSTHTATSPRAPHEINKATSEAHAAREADLCCELLPHATLGGKGKAASSFKMKRPSSVDGLHDAGARLHHHLAAEEGLEGPDFVYPGHALQDAAVVRHQIDLPPVLRDAQRPVGCPLKGVRVDARSAMGNQVPSPPWQREPTSTRHGPVAVSLISM